MHERVHRARGFVFAIAFALFALAAHGPLIEAAPPRTFDIFVVGIALTTFFFSWAPALVLFAASLLIVEYTSRVLLWPPTLPDLLNLGAYCAATAALIFGMERLRTAVTFWRARTDELRRSEQALRESEALTRSVVYSAIDGIVTIDEQGLIRSFNPAAESLFGYAAEEVLGRNVSMLMPSPWRDEHDNYIRRCLQTNTRRIIGIGREVIALRKDGATFPAELAVSEMVLQDRRIFTGIVRDITQRKQAEEAVREVNETLRAVIETSPLAICVTDLEGKVRSWNPAAARIFGWTEAEVVGERLPIVPDGEWEGFLAATGAVARGQTYAGVERRRLTKSGAFIDISIWNAPLRNREGEITGILSLVADVTESRHMEQQLRQSAKMEAIGRLAGGVAHDFNNILTVITGYAEMLAEKAAGDEDFESDITEVLKAADHASALTNQLLVFSRHKVRTPETLNLNEVVERLEKMLRRIIGEDVALVTHTQPELSAIRADPAQIEQVIINLAVNARDAMPGGGTLTIETADVKLDAAYARTHVGVAPGQYVMLAVSDTGTGMAPETRLRLFEPFFTTKERGKGTGLGLSTVYGIVKQCNGEIWVYSELGRGSTFKIYLPVVDAKPEEASASDQPEQAIGGAETVLLVEDEFGVRKLVSSVLAAQGYQILETGDPLDALRMCEEYSEPIHLLLTDVVMPNMSGRDLAGRAVKLRPELRVLYMSGYTDHAVAYQDIDGAPFIQKPFSPGALARKIREVLDGQLA